MREILFRGVCTETGDWVKGHYVRLFDDKGNRYHLIYPGYAESDCGDLYPDWYEVDPETVGQFTGLTDKNGKKIFEGDIIRALVNETEESREFIELGLADKKVKVPTGNKIQAFWSVEWKTFSGSAGWRVYGKDRRFNRPFTPNMIFNCQCEVIGNMHDDPEILEKK